MLLNEITAVAALAAAANAFLLPSTMLSAEHAVPAALDPVTTMQMQHSQVDVKLDCPDCPAPEDFEDPFGEHDDIFQKITLDLPFALNPERTTLQLKDIQLFPQLNQGEGLTLTQHFRGDYSGLITETPPNIGWNIGFNVIEAADGSEGELINFDLQIVEIAGQPVTVDTVYVRLLRSEEEGRLSIVDVFQVPNAGLDEDEDNAEPVELLKTPFTEDLLESATEVCGSGLASVPCRVKLLIGATKDALFSHRGPAPADRPMGRRPCHPIKPTHLIGLSPEEIRLVLAGLPKAMLDELRANNGGRLITDLSPEAVHKMLKLPEEGGIPADMWDNSPLLRETLQAVALVRANEDAPPKPKIPLRGGPPKFWQPIAGDGPVHVDLDDGADFHAKPFFHRYTEAELEKLNNGEVIQIDESEWQPVEEFEWEDAVDEIEDEDEVEWQDAPEWHQFDGFVDGEAELEELEAEEAEHPDAQPIPFRFPHHHHHGHHGHHGPKGFADRFLAKHGREPSPFDRIGCAIRNFVINILIPAVIGIAAGITISGVGFVLGMGVLALYRAVFKKNSDDDEVADVDEKRELMVEEVDVEEEESLPVYSEKAEEV